MAVPLFCELKYSLGYIRFDILGSLLSKFGLIHVYFPLPKDLDDMNIEIMRNTLYKAYLEDFYRFCQVSVEC